MGLALPPFLMGGGATGIKSSNNNDSSSESEDWAEEPWTVDCPCGVNFDDGEEMVQCDECEVWMHTACCQVIKSADTFVCDKCKEKKRKEHEESEVAQLLVELPGKSVSFDERSNEMLAQTSYGGELAIQRRAHEHGVPGGEASMFVNSGVFSQQLWKCSGYVPKLLQVQYREFPEWDSEAQVENGCLFDAFKQPGKSLKKVKQEEKIVEDRLKLPAPGRKLELNRPGGKQKNKLRGLKDEKPQQTYSKRSREEVKEHYYSRKKAKTSPEVVKGESSKNPKSSQQQQSPKNPKAMKKSAVQEFMDVDTRVCSKCLKPEPVSNDDQGNLSKPLVCQECQKPRPGVLNTKNMEGPSDQCKKPTPTIERANTSQNLSPETASTELPAKQSLERVEPPAGGEPEKKAPENDSTESHQSSRQQQPHKPPALMKPPEDIQVYHRRSTGPPAAAAAADASVEQKVLQGCQLSVKTSSFSKSEIPSPASINSGGPSSKDSGAKTSPSSPKPGLKPPGKMALKASAASGKCSSSSRASAPVPGSKKSGEGKSSSGGGSGSGAVSSTKTGSSSQPALKPCKSSASQSGVKGGQVLRKPALSGQKSGSGKDFGDRLRDERSSILRSSPPGSATAAAAAAVPLNDEELALLLHQELNSSPRVPRVPRVRQAAAAISAQPSNILTKRALGGAHSASRKEHRLMWRKRHRDDLKESSRKHSEASQSSKKSDEEASSSRDSSEGSEHGNEDESNPVSSKKQQAAAAEADDGEKR